MSCKLILSFFYMLDPPPPILVEVGLGGSSESKKVRKLQKKG
jgi:hypothetical protein